ncbi:MAG TPA: hypothetical protein VMF30_01950 [Pirellulales bacterium]|nr:hypothetical protein [Pirellulales bacterium]
MAIAYLTALVGVPWPPVGDSRDASPYPCQGHRCGCTSAQQCWEHCCCFTPAQRLAWAADHGVEAPAALIAAANVEQDHEHADGVAHASSGQHGARSCCHKCAAPAHTASARTVTAGAKPGKKPPGYGFQAFKCHGISTLWVTSGAVAPVVIPPAWTFDWRVVGLVPALCPGTSTVPFLPAVPPPRSVAIAAAAVV